MPGIPKIRKYLLQVLLTLQSGKLYPDLNRLATNKFRIWDVENKRKQKGVIVVKSKERGARTKVTACNYSSDGNLIGGGALLWLSFLPHFNE